MYRSIKTESVTSRNLSHNRFRNWQHITTTFLLFALAACSEQATVAGQASIDQVSGEPALSVEAHSSELAVIGGYFEDGTQWAIAKPANYKGNLILDLDGANFMVVRAPRPGQDNVVAELPMTIDARFNGFNAWLLEQGYAYGGITREPVGYDFPKAVDMLVQARDEVIAAWGEPVRTLALGISRGSFAARKALELYPDIFTGGLIAAGGGAGEIAVLNNKLNALFVLKTLVDPQSPLTLVNIDVQTETKGLTDLLAMAMATPAGQARLALASAVIQFAPWTNARAPKPAPEDFEAQFEQIASAWGFAIAVPVRAGVEKIAGGNVSWNTHADYAELLMRSGRMAMVNHFYDKAELDLQADLKTLAQTPRISADPAALRRAEPLMTYSGKISAPVVNVDNDDPVDPLSDKLAYRDLLESTGNGNLLRILWSDSAGHVGMSGLDRATGFQLLIDRIDQGMWADTSLPSLQARAAAIRQNSKTELGASTLFEPVDIPPPANTWDGTDWGTYKGQ